MRFLIDNALSPIVARRLVEAGHDVAHVRDYGMQAHPDDAVLARASAEERVLVSADTDFRTLLSSSHATSPSVIIIRRGSQRRPEQQADLLLANLSRVSSALEEGSVIILESRRIRIRSLPIGR